MREHRLAGGKNDVVAIFKAFDTKNSGKIKFKEFVDWLKVLFLCGKACRAQ
jgi:Ca2+-binding EF-hand superfamily protein